MDLTMILDYGGKPIVLNRPYLHASQDLSIFREFGEHSVRVEHFREKNKWYSVEYVKEECARCLPLENTDVKWRYDTEINPHKRKWMEEVIPTFAPSQFEGDIPNKSILHGGYADK